VEGTVLNTSGVGGFRALGMDDRPEGLTGLTILGSGSSKSRRKACPAPEVVEKSTDSTTTE
jgi:hypothetical protein